MINYQLSMNIISKVSTNQVLDAELNNQHHQQLSIKSIIYKYYIKSINTPGVVCRTK